MGEVFALCALQANEVKNPQADALAGQAITLLRQAQVEGFFRAHPESQALAVLQRIPIVARRPDFQQLLKDAGVKR